MACDEELTRMPIKHTNEHVRGMAKSWGYSAAAGVLARDAKSGAFLYNFLCKMTGMGSKNTIRDERC